MCECDNTALPLTIAEAPHQSRAAQATEENERGPSSRKFICYLSVTTTSAQPSLSQIKTGIFRATRGLFINDDVSIVKPENEKYVHSLPK